MTPFFLRAVLCGSLALPFVLHAQMMQQMQGAPFGQQVSADDALSRALKTSSLTEDGKPFHAVLEIGKPGDEYSGQVEVWWAARDVYKLQITSPKFSQTKVVHGDRVSEKDDGDYYPRWLENFELSILDPVPMIRNFRGRDGSVMLADGAKSYIKRDDRPGGITDQMTWGVVGLQGTEPRLMSVVTTNVGITFSDWKKFDKKQIARTVTTYVEGYEEVVGHFTTLEELTNPDTTMFEVKEATPPEQRIATEYVSTQKEEAMLEKAPVIEWPTVREGKTDGYMIVYARTDRTGQVRETAKHNSDNPGLEDFAIEQALKYKFKPLVVNGVPMQMEMPLVLHFTSRIEDPIPVLSVEQMKKQMVGCTVGQLPEGTPKDTIVTIEVSVNEQGKFAGFRTVGDVKGTSWVAATVPMRDCRFAPLVRGGKATFYKGDVELTAK